MTFSKAQLQVLSAWEKQFDTAVNHDWSSNPGRTALQTIFTLYTSVTGDRRRFSDNCSGCILSLLKDCGRIYFRDKAEMEEMEAEAKKEVAVSPAPAKTVKKKRLATKK
jgi:hypothetical protein